MSKAFVPGKNFTEHIHQHVLWLPLTSDPVTFVIKDQQGRFPDLSLDSLRRIKVYTTVHVTDVFPVHGIAYPALPTVIWRVAYFINVTQLERKRTKQERRLSTKTVLANEFEFIERQEAG